MFEANKAIAGGFAGAFSDLLSYVIIHVIPGAANLPLDQQQNIETVVTGAVVAAAVYFTPNRPKGKPATRKTDIPGAVDPESSSDDDG